MNRIEMYLRREPPPAISTGTVRCVPGLPSLALRAAATAALLLAASAVAADEPEVLVRVDRQRVYEGQAIQYFVFLNHVEDPSPPKLEGLTDFIVAYRGSDDRSIQRMSWINGRSTTVSEQGREYAYQLTPRRTGTLTIPSPVVPVGGRDLRGEAITVEVLPAEGQDVVLMEIAVDRTDVFPQQPFAVTLAMWIRELPRPMERRNPLALASSPPQVQIPWVRDDQLPEGIRPETDWQQWLLPMKNGQAGFVVNGIQEQQSVFSMFDGPDYALFLPEGQPADDPRGGAKRYWRYAFSRTFVPSRPGTYTFGPASLDWLDRRRPGDASIYALARPVAVTVKEVPAEGRPATFTGAIGKFRLQAALRPTELRVGDPATLVLTLGGQGALDAVAAPDLSQQPEFKDFRFYEATEAHKADEAQFTYSLRPLRAGITAFPPVPMTYFDVDQGRYLTLRSEPIPLHVSAAESLAEDEIVAAALPPAQAAPTARREGIYGNVTDLDDVRDDSVQPARWFAGLGVLAGGMGVLAMVIHRRRRPTSADTLRRRGAAARARERLSQAREHFAHGKVREGAERVRAALAGLVASYAAVPDAGLTASDVRGLLVEMGVADEQRDALVRLLDRCDALLYGATDAAHHRLPDDAAELVDAILPALRRRRGGLR